MSDDLTFTLNYGNGRKEELSVYSLARWFSLLDAFDCIQEYANVNKVKIGELKSPASLYTYINSRQPYHEEKIHALIKKHGIFDDRIFKF